jgi:hypothetical protein
MSTRPTPLAQHPDGPAVLSRAFAFVAVAGSACTLLVDILDWTNMIPKVPGNAHDMLVLVSGGLAGLATVIWAHGVRHRQRLELSERRHHELLELGESRHRALLELVDDRKAAEERGHERGRAEGYEDGYNQGFLEGAAQRAPRDGARVASLRSGSGR